MNDWQLFCLEHEIGMRADRCMALCKSTHVEENIYVIEEELEIIRDVSRKLYLELTGNAPWDTTIENDDGAIKEEYL